MHVLTIFTGPNGAGKSSIIRLVAFHDRDRLLEADAIAARIDASDPRKLSGGAYTYFSAPGQAITVAFGINGSGQIVGETGPLNPQGQGFLYENGTFTLLNHPNAYYAVLTGINDLGTMAGYHETADQSSFIGFTYNGGVFTDISLPQPGSSSVQVLGNTNEGVIYGAYGLL